MTDVLQPNGLRIDASGRISGLTFSILGNEGVGPDGIVTLDGTVSVPWATLSNSIYSVSRNVVATSLTVNSGVTLATNGYKIIASDIINNGTISCDGGAAGLSGVSNNDEGGGGGGGYYSPGGAGGYNDGTNTLHPGGSVSNSLGGNGGNGSGTVAAAGTATAPSPMVQSFSDILHGTQYGGGAGGGGGVNSGGGGGGGLLVLLCDTFTNSGSIHARGGAGCNLNGSANYGGGGGGGGVFIYYGTSINDTGTMDANGGLGAPPAASGANGMILKATLLYS